MVPRSPDMTDVTMGKSRPCGCHSSLVAKARITLLCDLCKNTASVEIIVSWMSAREHPVSCAGLVLHRSC